MDALLDTHVFLWYLEGSSRLSSRAREAIESRENKLYFSVASLWEIAVKLGLEKLEIQYPFQELQTVLEELEIKILPITFIDTKYYLNLPLHHRDPFDRMLVAQVIRHSFILISQDIQLDAYSVQRLWT